MEKRKLSISEPMSMCMSMNEPILDKLLIKGCIISFFNTYTKSHVQMSSQLLLLEDFVNKIVQYEVI